MRRALIVGSFNQDGLTMEGQMYDLGFSSVDHAVDVAVARRNLADQRFDQVAILPELAGLEIRQLAQVSRLSGAPVMAASSDAERATFLPQHARSSARARPAGFASRVPADVLQPMTAAQAA